MKKRIEVIRAQFEHPADAEAFLRGFVAAPRLTSAQLDYSGGRPDRISWAALTGIRWGWRAPSMA